MTPQDVERELETVEDLVARVSPGSEPLPVPTLAELQNELRSDEALLSFQLWPRDLSLQAPFPEGRSWLLVLTRHSAFAVRVPDAHRLAPEVSMFLAVLGGRAGSARVPGQSLHRELLRDALDRLPPDVRQLIVIPDGPLHALPLETLRSEDGRALAERYSVAVVPSATLWYRWVHGAPTGPTGALALADPSPPGEAGIHRDAARWLEGLRLPSLPQARAESEAMVAALGEGGMLRTGDEASEHFLKRSDLARWGVVHLATHAVVDETQPDRSAVVLAPGSEEEDGLLQPREIGKLDLRGKIVVLSGCRTAGGPVFRGEGPLGLVHAFFQAGARAVIASPWPLDDRGARELVGELAGRLRQGQTLAASLAGAKRTLIREGVAESVWAGLQLYGDGRITLASPVAQRSLPVVAMSAGLLGAVLLALLASRQSRASGAEVDQRDERAGRP